MYRFLPCAVLVVGGCASTSYSPPPRNPVPPEVGYAMTGPAVVLPGATVASADPLAGTEWRISSVMGSVVDLEGTRVRFNDDGTMMISALDHAGGNDPRRYVVDGSKLTMIDPMGIETIASYRRLGSELTIDGPKARVLLELVSGPADVSAPDVAPASNQPDDPDHPIRGTRWELMQTFGNVPIGLDGGTFEFRSDGWLVMNLLRHHQEGDEIRRRYRVTKRMLTMTDNLGTSVPCEISYTPRRLVIDLPKARVILAPDR